MRRRGLLQSVAPAQAGQIRRSGELDRRAADQCPFDMIRAGIYYAVGQFGSTRRQRFRARRRLRRVRCER